MQNLPVVALVGAPNAGKSTLLNKIAGEHLAVTSPVPGTTRDRQYAEISWNGKDFLLLDTAGLDLTAKSELESSVQEQIKLAIEEASIIVLVADYKTGPEAMDRKVLLQLRKNKLQKILAVNKVDSPKVFDTAVIEFAKWGIKPAVPVSAITGRGVGDLLDEITSHLPKTQAPPPEKPSIKVALIGKPNVGKSSIFNFWVGQKRMVVSSIPGTTRTAIDTKISFQEQDFTLIDTAGLKRKSLRQDQPDLFAGFQTYRSIRKSDVSILVIDATTEITKQDLALAREILDQEKGCIIAVNKIDLYRGSKEKLHAYISTLFPFLWMCPVFFVSADTGEGLNEIFPAVVKIFETRNRTLSQESLDELLKDRLQVDPPRRLLDQKKPKIYELKQIGTNPPGFELLVNHPPAISENFRRSIVKAIIRSLDLWGTPLRVFTVKRVGEEKFKIEKS